MTATRRNTCIIQAPLFLLILNCASSRHLLPCQNNEEMACVVFDNTDLPSRLGHNVSARVGIKLNCTDLQEILFDPEGVALVSIDEFISQGEDLIDKNSYGDRLDIKISIELSTKGWGVLWLELFLERLEWADTRLMHEEIRVRSTVYTTKGKPWFPVDKAEELPGDNSTNQGDTEQETPVSNKPEVEIDGEKSSLINNNVTKQEFNQLQQEISGIGTMVGMMNNNLAKHQDKSLEVAKMVKDIRIMTVLILCCLILVGVSCGGMKLYHIVTKNEHSHFTHVCTC